MKRKLLAAILLSLPLLSTASVALDDAELADLLARPSIALYKAYAEFKMAHYDNARRIWTALAERGIAEAWFNLGILAEDGLGQQQDVQGALTFYERGALGGSAKAQYRLALLHIEGAHVAPDRELAEKWLDAAAAAGYENAARQLALLRSGAAADDYLAIRLLESEGHLAEAADAYLRLSEQGNLRARTRLAWLYETGRGIPRDLPRAAELFKSAAERGDAEAQFALSVMLHSGAGVPRDETAAHAWLLRAARAGYPEAVEALRRQRGEAPR